jgi:hypothetical protein
VRPAVTSSAVRARCLLWQALATRHNQRNPTCSWPITVQTIIDFQGSHQRKRSVWMTHGGFLAYLGRTPRTFPFGCSQHVDHHRASSCSTYAAPRRYPVVIAKSSTSSRESHNAQRMVISPLHFPCQNINGGNVRLVITLSAHRSWCGRGYPVPSHKAVFHSRPQSRSGPCGQVSPSTSGGHACGVRSAPALPLPGSRPVLA